MTSIPDPDLDRPILRSEGDGELADTLQIKIASLLWGPSLADSKNHKESRVTFFEYFKREVDVWSKSGLEVAIETYRDFLELIEHLRTHSKTPRNSPEFLAFFPPIEEKRPLQLASSNPRTPLATRNPSTTKNSIENALALTVGLWLMISMGPSSNAIFTGRSHVKWPDTSSLTDVIGESIPRDAHQSSTIKRSRWPKSLNARNLERIGSIRINWTSNLKDHLAFDEDSEAVALYHFASILDLYKSIPAENMILPQALLEETLRTLALLLPRWDQESKRWFEQVVKRANGVIDQRAAKQSLGSRGREVASFAYWNHRLNAIAEAYENSEPKSVKQWWIDRRKRVQWSTFWIAATVLLLTIVVGVITSVTGILQVYLTYQSLQQS